MKLKLSNLLTVESIKSVALSVKIKTNSSPQSQVLEPARSVNVCIKCSKELKVLKSANFSSTDPVISYQYCERTVGKNMYMVKITFVMLHRGNYIKKTQNKYGRNCQFMEMRENLYM